jgi:diaminopimelate epimerase
MRFEKWQALGNDYLIVERGQLPFAISPGRVRRLCDPHFGVGSDGILLLSEPAEPQDVADLRIFNPDGSEAELSGNGAREAILYLRHRGWTDHDTFSIGTPAGRIRPTITGPDTCSVDMGTASLSSEDFPGGSPDGRGEVSVGGHRWDFRHVSIGNPQCSIRVDSMQELEELDLGRVGPPICNDPRFPNRTNVSWYAELAGAGSAGQPAMIRARIFERGVGETLSSGTGASGAAIAYCEDQGPRPETRTVVVSLDGGQLEVEVGEDLQVTLTGWARPVFAGELSEDLEKELHETE